MTSLPELKVVVAELQEVYQPIYGHPELSTNASRSSEERLQQIMAVHHALVRQLQRPIRVLDLGCAQGWFGFNLAQAGAEVLGVDYDQNNINVCNMLVLENRELAVRFKCVEIEKLVETLGPDQFDMVLGLSVFHHLCLHNGKEATRDLVTKILEKVRVGLFEMALADEPFPWAKSLAQQADYLIATQPFVRLLAYYPTHLSSYNRPFYYCSSRYWYLDNTLDEFTSFSDNRAGRRYFFGDKLMAKLYRTDGERGDINRYAISQAAQFLISPPEGYIWAPKILAHGEQHGTAWIIQEKIQGTMLSELIVRGDAYDERSLLLGVLAQLVALEKHNLYHADVRVWNIIVGKNGFPYLIDYNEISMAKHDCVWPDNPFLAFFLFVNEVVTHRIFDTEPSRAPFISPYNFPEPYRSWLSRLWYLPVSQWSFAFMHETLKNPPTTPLPEDSATALWMQTIEQNLENLNDTMRSLSQLVLKLHEVVSKKT